MAVLQARIGGGEWWRPAGAPATAAARALRTRVQSPGKSADNVKGTYTTTHAASVPALPSILCMTVVKILSNEANAWPQAL